MLPRIGAKHQDPGPKSEVHRLSDDFQSFGQEGSRFLARFAQVQPTRRLDQRIGQRRHLLDRDPVHQPSSRRHLA